MGEGVTGLWELGRVLACPGGGGLYCLSEVGPFEEKTVLTWGDAGASWLFMGGCAWVCQVWLRLSVCVNLSNCDPVCSDLRRECAQPAASLWVTRGARLYVHQLCICLCVLPLWSLWVCGPA